MAHDQRKILKWTKRILTYTEDKYKEIENLQLNLRKRKIKQELEFLSHYYSRKGKSIELDFEEVIGESFEDFFYSRVKRGIQDILEKNKGELQLKIKLFNPELNEDVIEKLNDEKMVRYYSDRNARFPFLIEFEFATTSEGIIIADMLNLVDFDNFHTGFDKRDNLKRMLYTAIYLNLNRFKINVSKEDPDNFLSYLKNRFPDEYENPYFNFYYENDSKLLKISLK